MRALRAGLIAGEARAIAPSASTVQMITRLQAIQRGRKQRHELEGIASKAESYLVSLKEGHAALREERNEEALAAFERCVALSCRSEAQILVAYHALCRMPLHCSTDVT